MLLEHTTDLALGCISDLMFDSWRGGELDAARTSELSRHLEACQRCAARNAALAGHAQSFLDRPGFSRQLVRLRAEVKQRRRNQQVWLSSLALAAIALLALLPASTRPFGDARRKGTGSVGFYVRRGDEVFRGQSGQHVQPGDQLRFTWRSDRPAYLMILSLDAVQAVSTYYPPTDLQQPLVPGGREIELDGAVELDEALGPEHVYVVSCNDARAVNELRQQLAATQRLTAPAGCQIQRLELFKEPRR